MMSPASGGRGGSRAAELAITQLRLGRRARTAWIRSRRRRGPEELRARPFGRQAHRRRLIRGGGRRDHGDGESGATRASRHAAGRGGGASCGLRRGRGGPWRRGETAAAAAAPESREERGGRRGLCACFFGGVPGYLQSYVQVPDFRKVKDRGLFFRLACFFLLNASVQ